MVTLVKSALITGAAQRIGRAIAERFLAKDYRLVLHANASIKELKQWVSSHPKKNNVLKVICADLAEEEGQHAVIFETGQCVSSLDLIVHNASIYSPSAFAAIDRKNYRQTLGVNLEAPFFITQGLLPILMKSHRPSVINIVDAMWQRPAPQFSHYAISKAGLAILTRALANEFAPHLRVNAVAPGAIVPPAFRNSAETSRLLERVPFKRLGLVEDIANAVFFLSEVALYASGEILVIDGGRSIAP